MEFWLHPLGIISIIMIAFSVVIAARIIIFCVMHWRGVLILAGIIGIPVLLYKYADEIMLFFRNGMGEDILYYSAVFGIIIVTFKIVLKIREKILLDKIVKRSLRLHHEKMAQLQGTDTMPEGEAAKSQAFELDRSGKYVLIGGKVKRNKNYVKPQLVN